VPDINCYSPKHLDSELLQQVDELMQQLRPQYTVKQLMSLIAKQTENGYRMALAENTAKEVVGIAGYELGHKLAWGHYLYIDDLVVNEQSRGQQVGQALLEYCYSIARQHNCDSLHLDSGSQRHRAHKFYLSQGMHISSFHFADTVK